MFLESGENIKSLNNKYFCQLNLNTEDKNVNYGEDVIVRYSLTREYVYISYYLIL